MVLFTGVTVEEAIEAGLAKLGLSRSQAQITVLSKEKKGFLGFGKKLAQVDLEPLAEEVTVQVPQEAMEDLLVVEEVAVEVVEQELSEPVREEEAQDTPVTEEAVPPLEPMTQDDFAAFVAKEFKDSRHKLEDASVDVIAYLEKIIYEMDLEASITPNLSRRHIVLQIETSEPGRLIGYHGKVLKSLQLLAQNYLHDRYSRNFSISLNVRDYLEHRTEILIDFANKAAQKVLATGRPYRLDPMTNSERKIIHKTISKISGVESYSEGDDPERYVVIVSRD